MATRGKKRAPAKAKSGAATRKPARKSVRARVSAQEWAARGYIPTVEEKLAIKRNAAYEVSLCTEAVDRLHALAGANGIYDSYPIQRIFRDQHALEAAQHVAEVGRERIQVPQVQARDVVSRGARFVDRRGDRAVRAAPADHQQLARVGTVRRNGCDPGCDARDLLAAQVGHALVIS